MLTTHPRPCGWFRLTISQAALRFRCLSSTDAASSRRTDNLNRRVAIGAFSERGYRVKRVRVLPELEEQATNPYENRSDVFVFYNKKTGVAQFRAEALAGEGENIERAAGLLAIQCLMRGHNPENFTVLVEAPDNISSRLVSRAQELLEEGRAIAGPSPLSPRQKEILHSVVRHEANKEIASRLNITVRTVKFHISSLLSKFDVQSRGELARKAAGILGAGDHAEVEEVPEDQRPGPMRELMANADVRSDRTGQTLSFPRRVRTA